MLWKKNEAERAERAGWERARKGRMGEVREGFVEKIMFRQRGGRECKPCENVVLGVFQAQ